MKTVRFEDAADDELIDEIARYELRREGLGTEFLIAIRDAVRLIAKPPARGKHPSIDARSAGS